MSSYKKVTKMAHLWLETGDPPVGFEYRTATMQQMIARIFVKQYGI